MKLLHVLSEFVTSHEAFGALEFATSRQAIEDFGADMLLRVMPLQLRHAAKGPSRLARAPQTYVAVTGGQLNGPR